MPRVLFYVQHLVGLGHDRRAAAITRALVNAGVEVTYVTGGFRNAALDLAGAPSIALPPLKARNLEYDGLVGSNGVRPDTSYWAKRRRLLLEAFEATQPDAVIIETFPFGRWPFREEITALLERAAGKSKIVCSVRDVLEAKSEPTRNRRIVELIGNYFDIVLVHGDPQFIPLTETFAYADEISDRIRYTGYVRDDSGNGPESGFDGRDDVIVSAGGGATCRQLMAAAADAARRDHRRWRFLIGPNCPADIPERLHDIPRCIVEPIRPDFPAILKRAAASISQAGYNTVMDILECNIPAVLSPHQGHGQSEQWIRAARLAEFGRVALVPEAQLNADHLLTALGTAQDRAAQSISINRDGAQRTAGILTELVSPGIPASEKI